LQLQIKIMKKLNLVTVFILLGFIGASAQQNVVKINPVGLLFGSAELSYERVLSNKSSVELSLAYSRSNVGFSTGEEKATGFGVEGKYKFYVSASKNAPRGFYAAPVLTYASSKAERGTLKGKVSYLAGGAIAGYQWVFGSESEFSIDLNAGVQYVSASVSGDVLSASIDGIIPKLGIGFGYAW
jgi:hypothetical protein